MSEHQENSRCVLAAIVHELASIETRLSDFNRRSLQIIQFSLLLVGVAILAAQEYVEALAIVPVFWNVWLLYAVSIDRDTMKHVIYAEHLENRANALLLSLQMSGDESIDYGVFGFRLALRGQGSNLLKSKSWSENIAHNASMAIWTTLILSSTAFASVVLASRHWIWPTLLLAYQVAIVIFVLRANSTKDEQSDNFRKRLEVAVRSGSTSDDSSLSSLAN